MHQSGPSSLTMMLWKSSTSVLGCQSLWSQEDKFIHIASILRQAKDIINKIELDQPLEHASMSKKPRWEVILSQHGEGNDALI